MKNGRISDHIENTTSIFEVWKIKRISMYKKYLQVDHLRQIEKKVWTFCSNSFATAFLEI